MEYFEKTIKLDKLHLYGLWDPHLGSLFCRVDEVIKIVDMILKDPYGKCIIGGDTGDYIVAGIKDRRFDVNALSPEFKTFVELERGIRRIFKPLADEGKILHFHSGNHEEVLIRQFGDFMAAMCDDFGADYGLFSAITKLYMPKGSCKIYSAHGAGFTGSRSNDPDQRTSVLKRFLETKMQRKAVADFYLMGHTHMLEGFPPVDDIENRHGPDGRWYAVNVPKKPFFGVCGSYLAPWDSKKWKDENGDTHGAVCYGEKKMYDPAPTGSLMVEIDECGKYISHKKITFEPKDL